MSNAAQTDHHIAVKNNEQCLAMSFFSYYFDAL